MKVGKREIQTGLGFDMQNMLSRFVLRGWRQKQKGYLPKAVLRKATVWESFMQSGPTGFH